MAKILTFRPEIQPSTRNLQRLGSKTHNVVPISKAALARQASRIVPLRFPEAWLPFIHWSDAGGTT